MLKNTTLAAIVRDEEFNPSGGIGRFLEATLPYVEEAIIVDTGSKDRTKDILSDAKKNYPHLRVVERAFDDFASSRNVSLKLVNTKKALVLDADEIIMPEEFKALGEFIERKPARHYGFTFKVVYSCDVVLNTVANIEYVRLFDVKGARYVVSKDKGHWEDLHLRSGFRGIVDVPTEVAMIKHFKSSRHADEIKSLDWYGKQLYRTCSPFDHAKEWEWKLECSARKFFDDGPKLREAGILFPRLVDYSRYEQTKSGR